MNYKCAAADPNTCRYHGQRNVLHNLIDEAEAEAAAGHTSKYLELKERADIIAETYKEAEAYSNSETERNNHINGSTNENDITNRIRAKDHADYIIDRAFNDYNAHTYDKKKEILEAKLVLDNNQTETEALFDLEGNMVSAKLTPVTNNYTGEPEHVWGVLENSDPKSNVKEWFRPSKAKNENTARNNNKKKGYYIGKVKKPGVIKRMTHSTLSGSNSWPEIVPNWTTPFDSKEIEIIDNGQEPK